MSIIIQTKQLTKSYGRSRGIIDLTFAIQEGAVFGFLGPNGAGKTTAMRTLMGLLRPTSGNATICGFGLWNQTSPVNKPSVYLPFDNTFYRGFRRLPTVHFRRYLPGRVDQTC